MSQEFVERRRSPRVSLPADGPSASLPTALTVQLLDISESGVLLASPQRIEAGRRVQLRTRIGVEPLSAQVEVRRVASDFGQTGSAGYRLGVAFVGLDPESQRKLERLVKVED